MNLSRKQKRTQRHTEQTCGCQGGGKYWESGINRCTLLYTGCINSKVLLHSTGSYIQHPAINHNGKEYFKTVYMYTRESLSFIAKSGKTL